MILARRIKNSQIIFDTPTRKLIMSLHYMKGSMLFILTPVSLRYNMEPIVPIVEYYSQNNRIE